MVGPPLFGICANGLCGAEAKGCPVVPLLELDVELPPDVDAEPPVDPAELVPFVDEPPELDDPAPVELPPPPVVPWLPPAHATTNRHRTTEPHAKRFGICSDPFEDAVEPEPVAVCLAKARDAHYRRIKLTRPQENGPYR